MATPGFRAEASIYESRGHYRTTANHSPTGRQLELTAGSCTPRPCGPCVPDNSSRTGCSMPCFESDCEVHDRPCTCPAECSSSNCPSPKVCCKNVCTDLGSDPANCGQCRHTCYPLSCCSGTCTETINSNTNCGSCGNVCSPDRVCEGITCVCKQSGLRCTGGQCENGACVCPPGLSFCSASDACIDLHTDPNNCGTCGNACSGVPCVRGTCFSPPPSCSFGCAIAYGLCTLPCTADILLGKDWFACMCECLTSAFGSPGCCTACGVVG
jgi:hypothetical protein